MIAACRASAPRRTSAETSNSPASSIPFLNQLMSPPAQKAAPAPVTIRARIGARSASQAAAVDQLLDQFRAHRVEGVGPVQGQRREVPVDLDLQRVQLRWGGHLAPRFALSDVVSELSRHIWQQARKAALGGSLPFGVMADENGNGAQSRAERIAEQRRDLPDQPGVYLFYGEDDELLYVGKARSIKKRIASHFSGGEPRLTSRIERIDTLVTANEAEALLAEQSFIKRHRPRFNIRLRDDKSYPYVAVSLDEDYPARLLHPRETPRPPRLLRPLQQRQAPARDPRPARQTVPVPHLRGRRAGPPLRQPLPRLLHQALRGALRRPRLPGGVPAQHRRDHRLPLRPLPPGGKRAGSENGGGRGAPRNSSARRSTATASKRSARCSSASASPAARSAPPT